jgi:hypothetical protein
MGYSRRGEKLKIPASTGGASGGTVKMLELIVGYHPDRSHSRQMDPSWQSLSNKSSLFGTLIITYSNSVFVTPNSKRTSRKFANPSYSGIDTIHQAVNNLMSPSVTGFSSLAVTLVRTW